jgi:hypothetical protein
MDPAHSKFAPPGLAENFGFFSTQGDFSSNLPTPLQPKKYDYSSVSSLGDNDSKNTFSTNSRLEEFSSPRDLSNMINMESDISSNYSSLPQKIKKHLRLNTNHLKQYSENDDKNIDDHVKTCPQCRSQLLNLLQEDKQNVNFVPTQQNGILNLSAPELKDILILIFAGIFIIILLDVFIRK